MQFVRLDTREPLSRRGVVVSISTIRGEIARFPKGHEFTRRAASERIQRPFNYHL